MKNKTGTIAGFLLGTAGFLFMFKLIILDHVAPSDELAPGIVVFIALLSGLLFAYAGHIIQNLCGKKAESK